MKIAIYHNLPGGGGIRMLEQIVQRYSLKNEVDIYVIGEKSPRKLENTKIFFTKVIPWRGFFAYNLWIIFILPVIHYKISKEIEWSKYDFVFFTHDYFTKSPYLMRFIKHDKKFYLCQESQREFYEPINHHASNLKEVITNLLRYPIKIIDRINVSKATKMFSNSRYSQKTLKKIYGIDSELVYPGVDTNFFTPGSSKKQDWIVCVGGINKTKNQEFLIKSLLPLLNRYKLILVGNANRHIKDKILKTHKNITILSNIKDNELKSIYRKSKLTCISAYREPFGLSSIESQSCGTPVLSVMGGGSVETIINGKTGYTSRINEEEFLQKAKKILKMRNIMSKYARKNAIEKWDINSTFKPLDKYFNDENFHH